MKNINQISLFVSCPSDIVDELNSISLIVKEFNKTSGKQNNFSIQIVHWDEDTYTEIGDDGQDVINRQIHYDILIGLMWLKIGTPTKRDKSGTVEEINRAISDKKKEQLIYFKTSPPSNINLIDTDSLNQVNSFKESLKNKILFKEYDSVEKFETLFRLNLSNLISDKFLYKIKDRKENIIGADNTIVMSNNYPHILDLIEKVENSNNQSSEIDIFTLYEGGTSTLNSVTNSLNIMTETSEILTKNLNKRTKEINIINNIKDNRLRVSRAKTVINYLSKELDEYNEKINFEIPIFSENLIEVGKIMSKLMLTSFIYNKEDEQGLRGSMLSFRDSMQGAMESTADLLKQIIGMPPINSVFNKSKRNTEIALKNLTKEIMHGLILMDEALNG